jgi:hypothetical protein
LASQDPHEEHDLAQCKDRDGNIIHAEGVRGDFSSSTPKACKVLSCQGLGGDACCGGASWHNVWRARNLVPCPPEHLAHGKTRCWRRPRWVTFGEQTWVNCRECRSLGRVGEARVMVWYPLLAPIRKV